MFFVNQTTKYQYEIKRSKFVSYLFPYSEFENLLNELKKEHTKARHFIYAFRYLNEFEQIIDGSSDDAEPKGTAGKPTLNTMVGAKLINSGIITVRYFGGIKLGTGGLVKSYSKSANLVMENSKILEFEKLITDEVKLSYSDISKFEYLVSKFNIQILDKSFDEKGGIFKIQGNLTSINNLKKDNIFV
jgi:uncharacterized YigZ family protein